MQFLVAIGNSMIIMIICINILKNKIHCSCPCCSPKTRNKGDRKRKVTGNYSRHLSYKWSDLKKIISMDMDEFETLGKRPSKKRKE